MTPSADVATISVQVAANIINATKHHIHVFPSAPSLLSLLGANSLKTHTGYQVLAGGLSISRNTSG